MVRYSLFTMLNTFGLDADKRLVIFATLVVLVLPHSIKIVLGENDVVATDNGNKIKYIQI